MTLFDFQLLSDNERIHLLYHEGVYIGKRKKEQLTALLYQLDSFYVEVIYRKYRRHIASMRCTASTAILDPYLEQIPVEHWAG